MPHLSDHFPLTRTLFGVVGRILRPVLSLATLSLSDNPIITKELRELVATRRAFIILAIFTGAIMGTIFLAWPRGDQLLGNIDLVASSLFNIVGMTLLVMVALLAPAYSSLAITGEKERRSFDLLITTGLSPEKILIGKLVSSVILLLIMIVVSTPLISLCLLLGGINPTRIVALALVLMGASLAFGLVGLISSCIFERNNAALGAAYAAALPLLGLFLYLSSRGDLFSLTFAVPLLFDLAIALVIAVLVIRGKIRRPPEIQPIEEEEKKNSERLGLVLDRHLIPDKWIAPPRRTVLLRDGANPVFDKELRSEIVGQGTLMLRVILQVGLFLAVLPFTFFYMFGRPLWYYGYLTAFTLLIAPAFTGGMFTGEHENRTFTLLITTLIKPHQIVWAKFVVGCRMILLILGILIAPSILAIGYNQLFFRDAMPVSSLIGNYTLVLLWAVLLVTISLSWSLISRRTTAALVSTYITGILIFVGPLLAHTIILSFNLLPEVWAERIVLISPLSHLGALSPPTLFGTSQPLWVVNTNIWGRWWIITGGMLATITTLFGFMTWRFEWVWKRWRENA